MYRALLQAQWKTAAPLVLLLTLAAFAVPLGQTLLTDMAQFSGNPEEAQYILSALGGTSPLYPFLALACGMSLAISCWSDDMLAKHIYALTLPVPRWYYLLLRMGVGLTMLVVPVGGLWIAALIAVSQVTLPVGLHGYPGGLTVRFALAASVAFAATFAMGSASERTGRKVLIGVSAVILLAMLFSAFGMTFVVDQAGALLMQWPSLVDVFVGRWLLIDV